MKSSMLLFILLVSLFFLIPSALYAQCETYEGIQAIAVNENSLFVGTYYDGIFLSTNDGTSWTAVNNGLTNTDVRALAVSDSNLFAGTAGSGVFLSTNNGTTWTPTGPYRGAHCNALSVSPNGGGGNNLFAGTSGSGVMLSTDNGTTWSSCGPLHTNDDAQVIVVNGNNVFTGSANCGVVLSTDNGMNWDRVGPNNSCSINGIVFFDANNNKIQENSELGISKWKVCFSRDSTYYDSTYTDVQGYYHFSGKRGKYILSLKPHGCFVQTTPESLHIEIIGEVLLEYKLDFGLYCANQPLLSVNKSWNIIAVPCRVTDFTVDRLFPTRTSSAFHYNNTYIIEDTPQIGLGYWLKFASSQSIPLYGDPLSAETVTVYEGWNIIGSISEPIAASSITSELPNITTSDFFGYTSSYVTSDTIYPGFGYWVKVNQDGLLILSSNPVPSLTSHIKIVPTAELPPSPPDGNATTIEIPKQFALEQNYPNPFNPITVFRYQLLIGTKVTLRIYNLLGQEIKTLVDDWQDAGYKTVAWDASNFASGVYFYRIHASSFIQTKKLILMR